MNKMCAASYCQIHGLYKENNSAQEGSGISGQLEDGSQASNTSIVQSLSTTAYNMTKTLRNDKDLQLIYEKIPESNQFVLPKRYCAVYDTKAPVGCRFTFHDRFKKRNFKRNGVDVLAKLNELKLDNDKNPVAKLYEITALKKKNIEYEVTSISGTAHSPIFTVRAKNDDITAYGHGSSKKDAKKNAAIEFLKIMDSSNCQNVITSTTSNEDVAEKVLEKQSELNPIGVVQELCMANHWQLPHYEIEEVINESNTVTYSAEGSLKMFKFTGIGKTKQSAKKQAARLLYDKVKSLTPEEKDVLNCNVYETPSKILLSNNQFSSNKLVKQGMIIPSEVLKYVEMFINQLNLSKNPSINQLKSLSTTKELKNAVDVLNRIGEEEGFTSTYVRLDNNNSKPEVLVQVALFPLLVNMGTGNTIDEAQETAAYGALVYLKLLLEQ